MKKKCDFFGQHFSRETIGFLEKERKETGATVAECLSCKDKKECLAETDRKKNFLKFIN